MGNDSYARTARGMFDTLSRRLTSVERRLPPSVEPASPAGTLVMTVAATTPAGWLYCDGQSLLRSTYPDLFSVIGTTYGAADGTHFNVPNLKGRVPVGLDPAQTEFNTLGETGGAKTHTLTESELAAHSHSQVFAGNAVATGGGAAVGGMTSVGGTTPTTAEQSTPDTGGDAAHNNLQPYMVVRYLIKT